MVRIKPALDMKFLEMEWGLQIWLMMLKSDWLQRNLRLAKTHVTNIPRTLVPVPS